MLKSGFVQNLTELAPAGRLLVFIALHALQLHRERFVTERSATPFSLSHILCARGDKQPRHQQQLDI